MNVVILMGRLVKDPEIKAASKTGEKYARYTLCVERESKDHEGVDYIDCICFGNAATFAERFLTKGKRIAVVGQIRTGVYKNKEGESRKTFEICVSRHDFADAKGETGANTGRSDFMTIPDEIEGDTVFN